MDRGVHVVAHDLLVEQNSVLVVVTFPGHEADKGVLAQADLAVLDSGTISDHVAFLNPLAHGDHRHLVDAGTLVGAHKLDDLIVVDVAVISGDTDQVSADGLHHACPLCQHAHAGVHTSLIFHTSTHDGALSAQQRHSLLLHVRSHQSAVGVVVFQEGNHGSCHGNNHPRRNIHVIGLGSGHFHEFVLVTADHSAVDKMAFLVQRFVGLSHNEFVLHVSGHVDHFIGDAASLLVHLPVGSLNEAILVDPSKSSQIRDQTDVRTFGSLDGAHTTVVGVVHVTDLERGAVTRQTARTQSGQTPLVSQLRQGVGLVHELGQRRGTEELLDRRHHRPDVDQAVGSQGLQILSLQGHTLTDHTLQTGETNAELVLEQLAHRTDTPVAQVVDVIGGAQTHCQAVHIVDGREDVVHSDVVGDQVRIAGTEHLFQLFLALSGFQDLSQHTIADTLVDAALGLSVEIHILLDVHHAVGDDLHLFVVEGDHNLHHAGIVHGVSHFLGDGVAGVSHHLTSGIGHGTSQHLAYQTAFQTQLLVVFITAHTGKIIPAGVEEQTMDMGLSALNGGRLAGTQFAINLKQRLFHGFTGIFFDSGANPIVIAEEIQDLLIGAQTQAADKHRDGDLPVFVDAHIEHIVHVVLIFQPGAPVRDNGGTEQLFTGAVIVHLKVHTGRTHQLGDDHTLGAVDDEGAAGSHQREVAHEHFGLLDLPGLLVQQARGHPKGRRVSGIPLLALGHAVIGLIVELVTNEIEHQIVVEVCNTRNVLENLFQALCKEPFIGILLDLNEVRHFQDFLDLAEAHSSILAQLNRFNIHHLVQPLQSF